MDPTRFDALARSLTSRHSRRGILAALALGAAGGFVERLAGASDAHSKRTKPKAHGQAHARHDHASANRQQHGTQQHSEPRGGHQQSPPSVRLAPSDHASRKTKRAACTADGKACKSDAQCCGGACVQNGACVKKGKLTGKCRCRSESPGSTLLAPVAKRIKLSVRHGYNDPTEASLPPCTPGQSCNNGGDQSCDVFGHCCPIGTASDHCGHQQDGLDLTPGHGWNGTILAPADGIIGWGPPGGECLGITLNGGTNLSICHFGKMFVRQGQPVHRGCRLGTTALGKDWVHLSLDDGKVHAHGGPSQPIPFTGPFALEGKDLTPDGSQDQRFSKIFPIASTNADVGICPQADPCAGVSCAGLPHVRTAHCSDGLCVIDACASGFLDCDGDPATGCEAQLGGVVACRACGDNCPDKPCNIATCDPQLGCGYLPRSGDACQANGIDGTCVNGECITDPCAGKDCSGKADPCNDGSCQNGACVAVPKQDGASCGANGETCWKGQCYEPTICTQGLTCGSWAGQVCGPTAPNGDCWCSGLAEGGYGCGSLLVASPITGCRTNEDCEAAFGPGALCGARSNGCYGQVCIRPCSTLFPG